MTVCENEYIVEHREKIDFEFGTMIAKEVFEGESFLLAFFKFLVFYTSFQDTHGFVCQTRLYQCISSDE